MANKVAIVTDSTPYLPKEFMDKYTIRIAPAIIIWEDEELRDNIDITSNDFYKRLSTAEVMPTTSQPSPAVCKEIFDGLLAEGYDILCMPLSNKLSGTFASMNLAKDMLPDANIEIHDSLSTSMATGWQIMKVGEAANNGASMAECKTIAEEARKHTHLILTVDTLEFLHRGGRIGGAQKFIGTALNFKPIMEVLDGRIEPVERVRTRKKSLNRLVEIAVEKIGDKKPVYLACLHANIEEDAKYMLEKLSPLVNATKTITVGLSPAVGTQTGPGTIGLAWMAGYE